MIYCYLAQMNQITNDNIGKQFKNFIKLIGLISPEKYLIEAMAVDYICYFNSKIYQ